MVNIQLKAKTARGLFKEGFENIFKNRLVSIVAITTVFISLTIFGVFYLGINIINENINNMQDQVEIIAFLENDLEESEIDDMKGKIEAIENVNSVKYISSEEGLYDYKESFINDGDEEMAKILEESATEETNPIPASFSIATIDPTKNATVKDAVSSFQEIYRVNDGNVVTTFLNRINRYAKIIGTGLMVALTVVSMILISNSIKIAVFIRKKEISIIKYIGATNNYIRLPFIIEGLLIGTIGALLSGVVLTVTYNLAKPSIITAGSELMNGFTMPAIGSMLVVLIPIMIAIGAGIGVVGSLVSIRKYLRV